MFRRRRLVPGPADPRQRADGHRLVPPDGSEMTEEDWQTGFAKSLGVFLNGDGIDTPGPRGERIVDDSVLRDLQCPSRGALVQAPGRRLRRRLADRARHGRQGWRRARRRRPTGRRGASRWRVARSWCCAGSSDGRTAGHLPAPAPRRVRSSTRRPPSSAYLAALGVSHVYISPLLQAAPGSRTATTSSTTRQAEPRARRRGGAAPPRRAARRARPGPRARHRAEPHGDASPTTRGGGTCSRTARRAATRVPSTSTGTRRRRARNLVLLPILGDHYGRVLEAGELRLERDGSAVRVRYRDHALPGRAALARRAARPPQRPRCDSPSSRSSPRRFARLPSSTATDRVSTARRHRDKERPASRARAGCWRRAPTSRPRVDAAVAATNADPDRLDALLERQNYRLAYWRSGARDLGYRRFFDIDDAGRAARRGPAGVRGRARARARSGARRARSTGCASTTWTACATRPATSSACARLRPAAGSWSRRSSSRASGCPRLAGRRHDRLRLPAPAGGLFVDPPASRADATS